MSSKNLLQQIKNSHSLFQVSLDRGWQEFQQTETFAITKQLSEQINWWYSTNRRRERAHAMRPYENPTNYPNNVTHLSHRQSPNNKGYRYFPEGVRAPVFPRRSDRPSPNSHLAQSKSKQK